MPEMENSLYQIRHECHCGPRPAGCAGRSEARHRRILYAMYEDNLTSDKPFKKSATCVGDVLGRYHPHGDASVYDAGASGAGLFPCAICWWTVTATLGSVDGDPRQPTVIRRPGWSKISDEMLRDIEKDTVDWDPQLTRAGRSPVSLPSRFPNLLVNGSSGIAVGMATNIPAPQSAGGHRRVHLRAG